MKFEYIFWTAFLVLLANLAWRFFRNGFSLAGAMLDGRVVREIGEVTLAKGALTSHVPRVSQLESSNGEKFLGLAVVSKVPLATSMAPYRPTRSQAQDLIRLLQRASGMPGAA